MANNLTIGAKVRFLNEVGGGTVAGFQGKDIVLVRDDDGFDIPMLRSQVVAIETNANNFERPTPGTAGKQPKHAGIKPSAQPLSADSTKPAKRVLDDNEDYDPADRPVTFKPKAQERKGGDSLNVCLAFIPENVRELTATRFEGYLINDSNYYLSVFVASNEGAAWHCRWQGTMEPNTKQLLETFDRTQLNDLERLSVQLIAWKEDKPFMLKPAIGVELRLDTVKFYKLHVFQPSPFFREPALIYDIVRNDRPIKQVFVEAEEVLDAIRGGESQQEMPSEDFDDTEADDTPVRTREQDRQALKAAKRALKAEQQAKQQKERAPHVSKPNHKPAQDVVEIDLHISALLDNTAGLSNSVLLNTQLTEFRTVMERYKSKKGQKIVFIHGKGEGVLRDAIIKELRHRYKYCTYQDASFREYGFGATMVTVH